MTENQERALNLASDIIGGTVLAESLKDTDWQLLLLAADLLQVSSHPVVVARRVLRFHQERKGFFANMKPGPAHHHSPPGSNGNPK